MVGFKWGLGRIVGVYYIINDKAVSAYDCGIKAKVSRLLATS